MRTDYIDQAIELIAQKNRVVLSRDDPMMIVVTMQEHLLDEATATMQGAQDKFLGEMAFVLDKMDQETKSKTERILTAAVNAHKKAMTDCVTEFASKLAAEASQALLPSIESVIDTTKQCKLITKINLGISFLTAICLGVMVVISKIILE